jgi:hypothetical protein
MVKVYSKDGTVLFEEPPYTWEEEQEFYRRMGGGPKVVLHAPAAKKPANPKRSRPVPPAAANPISERAFRREIISELMIALMSNLPD